MNSATAPTGLNEAPHASEWSPVIRNTCGWGAEETKLGLRKLEGLKYSLQRAPAEDLAEVLEAVHDLSSPRHSYRPKGQVATEIWDALACLALETENAVPQPGLAAKSEPVTPPPPRKNVAGAERIKCVSLKTPHGGRENSRQEYQEPFSGVKEEADIHNATFRDERTSSPSKRRSGGFCTAVLRKISGDRYDVLLPTREEIFRSETAREKAFGALQWVAQQTSASLVPARVALERYKNLSDDTMSALKSVWTGVYSLYFKHLSMFADTPGAYESPHIAYVRKEAAKLFCDLRLRNNERIYILEMIVVALSKEVMNSVKRVAVQHGELPEKELSSALSRRDRAASGEGLSCRHDAEAGRPPPRKRCRDK